MNEDEELQEEYPEWLTKNRTILETEFCRAFLQERPIRCIHGQFYSPDGMIADDTARLKKEIYDMINPWLDSKISRKVNELFNALKIAAYSGEILPECDRIHVANGTYFIDGHFSTEKQFCRNRLKVTYTPDAPKPERWLRFLSELLVPEDILTLQEYLGYCFLPTTKGQKMLILIGKGGEGKSRIGVVMNSIFGDNMNTTSIQKVESNQFGRADLFGKLLMVDDDMDMSTLTKTNYIKSIVTSECKMDLECKNKQSFQGTLYVRFLCFGNGALTAIHDRSDGFFRRQILLTTKNKPLDRVDDPFLSNKLIEEKEGIFLWCLDGLHRLLENNYHFTVSSRALENITSVIREANNIVYFLAADGYIQFKTGSESSTKDLYAAYKIWCEDNAEKPLSSKSFSNFLAQNTDTYHLEATNNIYIGNGKRCRGYTGIKVVAHLTKS